MKNSLSRWTARIVLPFFVAFAMFQPAIATAATPTFRMGSTFYPKTASGAVGAAVDVVALASRANPWIGAIALGYQIYQLAQSFTDSAGAAQTANIVAASQNVPTPTGWTSDANGNLVPPSTAVLLTMYQDASTSWGACSSPNLYASVDAVAQCLQSRYLTVLGWTSATYTISGLNITFTLNGSTTSGHNVQSVQSCPAGYLPSGSSCALSNAASVMYPSDGKPTIRANPSGGGFTLDPRDPDNASAPSLPTSITTDAGATVGSDTQINIIPNSAGGLDIITMQEYKNSDGTITTYKQTVSTNSSGVVTTTDAQNYPGSISQQTASSAALTPSTGTTLNLPTDYARQGEADAAATKLIQEMQAEQTANNSRVDSMLTEAPPTTEAIPSQSVNVNFSPVAFTTNAVCPADITFNIFGKDYAISYSPLCGVASGFRPFFLLIGAITASVVFIRGLP